MLSIFFASLLLVADPATLSGHVVSIADGDTLTLLVGKEQHRIRLHGIDAPERKQPFSEKAKQHLAGLVADKDVSVKVLDHDRYGRKVGIVLLADGTNVNEDLVKAGYAWWYRKYAPKDKTLETLEAEAKKARRGLWAEKDPVAPWEWRANQKADTQRATR